jgi:hypothetical protein
MLHGKHSLSYRPHILNHKQFSTSHQQIVQPKPFKIVQGKSEQPVVNLIITIVHHGIVLTIAAIKVWTIAMKTGPFILGYPLGN